MIGENVWNRRQAEVQASEALETAYCTLMRAAQELESYKAKLEQADTHQQKAAIINWAINYLVTGIYPNIRIDLLANAQADLQSSQVD
jgi:hypothetical protein